MRHDNFVVHAITTPLVDAMRLFSRWFNRHRRAALSARSFRADRGPRFSLPLPHGMCRYRKRETVRVR